MTDKANSIITSKQLIFIIIGAQIGAGIFGLPRIVTAEAKEDAWIAVILGAAVPFLSLYLIERLGRRVPSSGFTQLSQALFGRIIGSVLILLFVIYTICFESLVLRVFAELAKLYLLPQTPLGIVLFLIIITIIYIGSKGAKVLGRINEILFYILLLTLTILVIPIGQADYTNMLPVGDAGLMAISQGALLTAYSFAGTEVLLVFYYLVNRQEEVLKAAFTAVAITTILYLVILITCQMVFGAELMQRIIWPGLMLLKVSQVPVIERFEFVFLFLWMAMGAKPTLNMSFAASLSLSQLLKIDVAKYNTYCLIFICLAIYILALLPHDMLAVFELWDYAGYGFMVIGLGYPLLYHLAASLHGGKAGHNV